MENILTIERNYKVEHDNNYLYISIIRNGKKYITNYDPALETIMKSGIFTGATTNGGKSGDYLKFRYAKGKAPLDVYFHHIVFCFYYRGLNIENCYTVLKRFGKELKREKLCVDHLHENIRNNQKENLSLMTRGENGRKISVRNSRFNTLFRVVISYDGNHYRVQFTYLGNIRKHELRNALFYCSTPQQLLDCLSYIKKNKWEIRKNKCGELTHDKDSFIIDNNQSFPKIKMTEDIPMIQQNLSKYPLEKFKKWEK